MILVAKWKLSGMILAITASGFSKSHGQLHFFFTWERLNLELEIAGKEVGKLKGSQLCTLFPAHADIV